MKRGLPKDYRSFGLTQNFQLGEFLVSSNNPAAIASYVPTIEQVNNTYILTKTCLQPVRERFGALKITSGIVTQELNALRGGAEDSQHLFGEAADFIPTSEHPLSVFLWIRDILRWPGEVLYYQKKGHIHVALPNRWVKADQKIIL